MDNVTEIREQYAETLAEGYERSAEGLRDCAAQWAARKCFREADDAQKRAEFFEYISQDLRRPKNIRLSREQNQG